MLLLCQDLSYLGPVISKDGIATDPGKIEAAVNWQPPKNFSELQSFLGLTSYYRCFVEGFAKLAAPLHGLEVEEIGAKTRRVTEKHVSELWTDKCQCNFEELKGSFGLR